MAQPPETSPLFLSQDSINSQELFSRLRRGLPLILGLAALGLVAGAAFAYWVRARQIPVATLYLGIDYEKRPEGAFYPDDTPFQADDLRAATLVKTAAVRANLPESTAMSPALQAALGVDAIIPQTVVREREKQRITGQLPQPYFPSEFRLSLTRSAGLELSDAQCQRFLTELAAVYREYYQARLGKLPAQTSRMFEDLAPVDYRDYFLLIRQEIWLLRSRLEARGITWNRAGQQSLAAAMWECEARLSIFADLVDSSGATKDRARARDWAPARLSMLKRQEAALTAEDEAFTEIVRLTQGQGASQSVSAHAIEVKTALKRLAAEKSYAMGQLEAREPAANAAAIVAEPLARLESSYRTMLAEVEAALAQKAGPGASKAVTINQPVAIEVSGPSAKVAGALVGALGLLTGLGLSLLFGGRPR